MKCGMFQVKITLHLSIFMYFVDLISHNFLINRGLADSFLPINLNIALSFVNELSIISSSSYNFLSTNSSAHPSSLTAAITISLSQRKDSSANASTHPSVLIAASRNYYSNFILYRDARSHQQIVMCIHPSKLRNIPNLCPTNPYNIHSLFQFLKNEGTVLLA